MSEFSRFSRRCSVRQIMTKFARLKRDGSFEKYLERDRKVKYTDFTSDGKLPTKSAKGTLPVPLSNGIDEEIDLNKV